MKTPHRGRIMMILPFLILFGIALTISLNNSRAELKEALKSTFQSEDNESGDKDGEFNGTIIPVECKEDVTICS